MEIIDLSEEYEATYCKCLEDWSAEFDDAGDRKREWLARKKAEGLRVKLARDERGEIVGMIQYIPIEGAPAVGADLYYVYCVWVHGHKQGVGNRQKRGIGSTLLAAAEDDAKARGAKGIAAWGLSLPVFMRSKWFKKRGYAVADKEGAIELCWKKFDPAAVPPRLLRRKKAPEPQAGRVTVTCFRDGWCPSQNITCERMKRAAQEHRDAVSYVEIDTIPRDTREEWGIGDAIFVDRRQVDSGPPLSYGAIQKILKKAVKKSRA